MMVTQPMGTCYFVTTQLSISTLKITTRLVAYILTNLLFYSES
jgi:hypothetical protein